jgi:hypothetical protein
MLHPNLLEPGAVLSRIKAWPGNSGACGEVGTTASLDPPCARRLLHGAGRDERKAAGRTSERCGTRG